MKLLFGLSLACAALSALVALASMAATVAPEPGAEAIRQVMLCGAAAFLSAWLSVAMWARPGRQAGLARPPPNWAVRLLVGLACAYLAGAVFVIAG